jgi:hypothetical protein
LDQHTRIRINLAQREFEIEGSEAFVREHLQRVEALLDMLETAGPPASPAPGDPVAESIAADSGLGPFGEYIMRLPNGATEVDKMLAAGFWCQRSSSDDAFSTADASRRLSEHGVRLGNPSQCVRQSLMAKRLFMVQKGRYRVSQQGRAYLRQLMGPLIAD